MAKNKEDIAFGLGQLENGHGVMLVGIPADTFLRMRGGETQNVDLSPYGVPMQLIIVAGQTNTSCRFKLQELLSKINNEGQTNARADMVTQPTADKPAEAIRQEPSQDQPGGTGSA